MERSMWPGHLSWHSEQETGGGLLTMGITHTCNLRGNGHDRPESAGRRQYHRLPGWPCHNRIRDYPVLHKPIYSPTAYSSILNAHLAPGHFRALVMWFRRD